jgi:hypothetical protein
VLLQVFSGEITPILKIGCPIITEGLQILIFGVQESDKNFEEKEMEKAIR